MTSGRTQIIIAVIGLAGVLGGALFANWDKVFPSAPQTVAPPSTPPAASSPSRPSGSATRPASPPASSGSTASWGQQDSYAGDCKARPAGTVCVRFDDGFVWLVRGGVSGWNTRVEGGRTIQVAVTSAGRYEHVLGTRMVRHIR